MLSAMNKMSKDHMEMTDQFKHFMDDLEITQNQPKRLADNYFFGRRRSSGKDSFRSQRGDYLKKREMNDDKSQLCCRRNLPCCQGDQKQKSDDDKSRQKNDQNREQNDRKENSLESTFI